MVVSPSSSSSSSPPPPSGGGGGGGYTLGSGNDSGGGATSMEEVRRRRLASMEQEESASLSCGKNKNKNKKKEEEEENTTSRVMSQANNDNVGAEINNDDDEDDDDDEAQLRAAIALSMQDAGATVVEPSSSSSSSFFSPQPPPPPPLGSTSVGVQDFLKDFAALFWDDAVTTDNDKRRWLEQSISTKNEENAMDVVHDDVLETDNVDSSSLSSSSRRLGVVTKFSNLWGLVQEHGGPCGVLASIQAELLVWLLHGPFFAAEEDQVTSEQVRRALAMAIGMVLARAALLEPVPLTNLKDGQDETERITTSTQRVTLVLPTAPLPPPAAKQEEEEEEEDKDDEGSMAVDKDDNDQKKKEKKEEYYQGLSWQALSPSLGASLLQFHVLEEYAVTDANSNKNKNDADDATAMPLAIEALAGKVSQFLWKGDNEQSPLPLLDYFSCRGGVMLLTMSLVASRGVAQIQSEMDDPSSTRLTSQFGYCSQELMNLLLTGQAVSNVFDNTLTLHGALTCRGISRQARVGYLSQLEALRYCEVGSFYKTPQYPLWVVGSTSHFSVLFGNAHCLTESHSDALLEQCRRAFKGVEGGEEFGFIQASGLEKALKTLNLYEAVGGAHGLPALAAKLEVGGVECPIILWDDFWKATSRLLTGASVESILHQDSGANTPGGQAPQEGGQEPLLLTQYGHSADSSSIMNDEEYAKKLAAEWGAQGVNQMATTTTTTTTARTTSTTTSGGGGGKTDEELARELQAQWDAEEAAAAAAARGGGTTTTATANEAHGRVAVGQPQGDDELPRDAAAAAAWQAASAAPAYTTAPAAAAPSSSRLEFEKMGHSFSLHHYNGLRGGCLTNFVVTRLSPEEAVGASIALSSGGGSGGNAAAAASGSSGGGGGVGNAGRRGGDLEDVVRTKWPSCVFDWGGKEAPFID